ncbi:uncharacterized protein N7511_009431 [Penicillium nucicola]|uniref:uncharacterized protein n=1 Tax=Penicillium nucicola TaxID=1850975 RepID=UPI002544F832|nr:uncharacterized protein N7511_009431 [Penicillium nucicola]KAJ5747735.1 hypothetical protein N7511_009431 [Penicillium nucicola]
MSHTNEPNVQSSNQPLAIVGMGLRYPGDVNSSDDFWDLMMDRRCASTKFPSDRLGVDKHYHPDNTRMDSLGVDGGHFISGDLGAFDAPFFSLPAAEAEGMDPQQRIVLETAYQALENAGLTLEQVAGSQTCVFTGCSANDYATFYSKDPQRGGKYAAYGQSMNMVANRISWFYNLKGPSVNVDTACSSGLVALDMACQSIWSGVSKAGLVVGANLMFAREFTNALDNLGVLSRDNRCFTFDERANGYGRGEGIGVLIIKPVEDAIRDGHTIRAVIRATRSNQDGWTPGITHPSREAQLDLMEDCYREAGLDTAATRYFEAHGTGTPTGDPIETRAIGALFRPHRSLEDPLYVGSVKTNIGHLEGGSGIAGIIKVALSLEKGIIPPVSENFNSPNPAIDLDYLNLKVVTEPITWAPGPRRASVNSFGFGGTNSHAILDDSYHFVKQTGLDSNSSVAFSSNNLSNGDYNTNGAHTNGTHNTGARIHTLADLSSLPTNLRILTWSSADEGGITRFTEPWERYFSKERLNAGSDTYLDDLAYTLNQRRSRLAWMTYALVDDKTKLAGIPNDWAPSIRREEAHTMAFVFSGQGAQWPAMGRELLTRYPMYRHSLIEAGIYLKSLGCEWDLLSELQKETAKSSINDPMLAQPLFGHSSGEIAAAYCVGAISREFAWRLAYFRGLWAAKLATASSTNGTMMAVALSPEQFKPYLNKFESMEQPLRVSVACINGPKGITLSGDRSQINELHAWLKEDGVFVRILPIPVAYHSYQMEEIAIAYKESVGDDHKFLPRCRDEGSPRMVSSVTGEWFLDAFQKLCTNSAVSSTKKLDGSHRKHLVVDTFVEIGPHAVMRGPCRDMLRDAGRKSDVRYLSLLTRNACGVQTTLETMAYLHCLGYPVDLSAVNYIPSKAPKYRPKVLTDLPPYCFNHSKSYWSEGPISKGFRFRRFGRHEMLGWPDDDWNPLLPNWSNILQPSDPIWVKDHQISNTVILPGASMLSMAIEAVKQLTDPSLTLTGFNFKNVQFMSALVIPTGIPSVDTRFSMRPQRDDEPESGGWYEFGLFSNKGSWTKHSMGLIQAVIDKTGKSDGDVPVGHDDILAQFHQMSKRSTTLLDREIFYGSLQSANFQFGSSFKCILTMATDQDNSLVTEIQTYTPPSPANWSEEYTIHPTTLDGLMQSTQVLLSQGGQKRTAPAVPTRIDRAWVSNTGLCSPTTLSFKTSTQLQHAGRQESKFGLAAVSTNAENVLIAMEGVTFTVIDSQQNAGNPSRASEESKCHQIEWRPDLALLKEDEIVEFFKKSIPGTTGLTFDRMNLDLMIGGFISRAINAMEKTGKTTFAQAEVQSYVEWLKQQIQINMAGDSPFSSSYWQSQIQDDTEFQRICDSVENVSEQGRLFVDVGKALLNHIRSGSNKPWSDIVDQDLLRVSYEEVEQFENSPGISRWKSYLGALGHKHPAMKILEIDGGIVSISNHVLESLSVDSSNARVIPRFAQFDISDSDGDRLAALEARMGNCGPRVSFSKLNIETDSALYDAENAGYDLVVVCLAFHGFTSIEKSLNKIRSMLKPEGKLAIIDMVNPGSVRSGFVHGLNERWWIHTESYRQYGNLIDESHWDEVLRQYGFSGSELVFCDHDDTSSHEISVIISSAVQEPKNPEDPCPCPISLLLDPAGASQKALAENLHHQLGNIASSVDDWQINKQLPESPPKDLVCIVLLELDGSILADMDPTIFQRLQKLALVCHKIIWVTSDAGSDSSPFLRVVDGLFRVLNSEDSRGVFTTLSLAGPELQANLVAKVVWAISSSTTPETEYIERAGVLHIPRFVEAPHITAPVAQLQASHCQERQQWNSGPPLKLALSESGMLDSLHFVEDTARNSPLPSDKIEIKVKAVGANFRDILVLLKRMDQTNIGFECAGVVTRVGKECVNFQVGDHVAGCDFDTYSSYARLHCDAAIKLPKGMSFAEAAAIPTNFVTAWHAFASVANVQHGETVLVHSAAGGTGQAAVQVAQYLGANVIATVGNSEKKAFLVERYGIPESHIFSSRDTKFVVGVKKITNGRGVDVVLNSLSGEGLVGSWECIAPYGRFVEMGKRDILGHSSLDMYHFARNVTFSAIDLAMITHERPHMIGNALRALMPLFSSGILRVSTPHRVYGIGELETGLRTLQGGQNSGKVVFEMRDHDFVDALVSPKQNHSFNPNVTYIVAGGLGGLGRNVTRWMVSCGARYLLLLSRSGAHSQGALSFIRELSARQVKVLAPACDITNRSMLEAVLGDASSVLPPIKGCIQATMVLQDAMFESMTHSQWVQATAPKISGTWNLHQLLPSSLDFFIMISSISSVMGNRGQANYAAANSFMDSLAHYRTARGERATSLNMGFFLSAGAVAESSSLREHFASKLPFVPVTEPELHALLSIYCDTSASRPTQGDCQVILGLTTSQEMYKRNPEGAYWLQKPAFRQILATDHTSQTGGDSSQQGSSGAGSSLSSANSLQAIAVVVMDLLSTKLSSSLGINKDELSSKQPMHSYGIDSLVAVELRNWFSKELNVDIAVFDMLGGATVAAVVDQASGQIFAKRTA